MNLVDFLQNAGLLALIWFGLQIVVTVVVLIYFIVVSFLMVRNWFRIDSKFKDR